MSIDIPNYEFFREKWLEFISKIPEEFKGQVLEKGVNIDLLWGSRDFCIVYLYHFQNMSSYEIAEKYKDFFISNRGGVLSGRRIREIIDKYNVGRKHEEALKLRVETGRMDYGKRAVAPRYIDYKKRDDVYKYKYGVGLKRAMRLKNINCRELAEQLGLDGCTVFQWRNLETRVRSDYQEKICTILKMNSLELFSETKPGSKPHKESYYYVPKLRKIIEKQKIPISLLSKKLHIPYQTLYYFKNIENKALSKRYLVKLADYLNLKWRDLISSKLKQDSAKNYLWAVGLNSYLIKTGVTKEDLAEYLKISRITISRYVFLVQRVPSNLAGEIAKYFNTPIDSIFKKESKKIGVLRLTASQKEHYNDAKRIYDETSSLAETGRRLNITRERVRQMLERGNALGLFSYKPKIKDAQNNL